MPKTTQYTLNANSGAFVNIPATISAHYVALKEDGAANGGVKQGIVIEFASDAFGVNDTYLGADQPVEIYGHGFDGIIARPANYSAAGVPASGDLYCKAKSASANTTTIVVYEAETAQR